MNPQGTWRAANHTGARGGQVLRHARKVYMTALSGPCGVTCTRLKTSTQEDSAKRVAIQIHNSTALSLHAGLTVVYDPLRPTHDCSGAGVTQRTCTGGSVGVELHHARPPWLSRRERHGAEDAAGSCGGRRRVGESERAGNAGGAMVRAWIANPGKQTLSALLRCSFKAYTWRPLYVHVLKLHRQW